jgi:zinc protease
MKTYKRIIFFLLLVFSGCSLRGNESVLQSGKVVRSILKNGLTVITKEVPRAELVSIEFLVKSGAACEGRYLGTGIAHFVEHMLFKGTSRYMAGDIARQVKLLGGKINGFTSHDYTGYTVTLPRENLDKAMDILVESIYFPLFDREEFEKERNVILNEMRLNEDDPGRKIFRLFLADFYLRHPYRHPVIGYPELFSRLNIEDLVNFHKEHYVPNNMILSVVGNFDMDLVIKGIEERLVKIERGREILPLAEFEDKLFSPRYHEEAFPTEIMHLLLGFPSVEISHEDVFALDLLAMTLGEGKSSRLYANLRQKKNLVYTIACSNSTYRDQGIFKIFLTGDYKNKDRIVSEVFSEIERVKKHPVSRKELSKVKNMLLSSYHHSHGTVESQAATLAANEFLTGDPDFSRRYIDRIQKLTSRDLMQVARKYLDADKTVSVVLRPAKQAVAVSKEIDIQNAPGADIEKIRLANGMTLLLRREHKLPTVFLQLTFLGGVRSEDEIQNGISHMCSKMMSKGTKYNTAEELFGIIETKGADLGYYSGSNSLGITMSLLHKDIDFGLKILSQIVRYADFPQDILDKEKIQTIARIKSIDDDPLDYALKLLMQKLFIRHPYGMYSLGEIETVQNLSRSDLIEFYNRVILPSNCILAIFGDIDKNKVLRQVQRYFVSWNPRGEFKSRDIPREPPIDSPRIYQEKTSKEQAILVLGFHASSMYAPDHYVLKVLNEILHGQGNRLFERVRERLGLSYMVGSYYVGGIDIGYFIFYAATGKQDQEKVKTIILQEIRDIQESGFTDEELKRSKSSLIGRQRRELETNAGFALMSALDELYGLGFDRYEKFEKDINAVTLEDLIRVARKYFKSDGYALVEIIPES